MRELTLDNIDTLEIEDESQPAPAQQSVAPRRERPMPILGSPAPAGNLPPLPCRQLSKPEAEIEACPVVPQEQFPADLKASFALLKKINELPEGTPGKAKRLEAIKQHCHKIQQGLPEIPRPPINTQKHFIPGLIEKTRQQIYARLKR